MLNTLYEYNDVDSLRLLIEAFEYSKFANIEDKLIVETVISYATIEQSVIGPLFSLERNLPQYRISNILDLLAESLTKLGPSYDREDNYELTDFALHLITRELKSKNVTPEKLWVWLSPLRTSQGHNLKEFNSFITNKKDLKLAIQKWVLLDLQIEESIRERGYRLINSMPILMPQENDLILLLGFLDEEDKRWKELVQLYHHGEGGVQLRQAALKFAEGSVEDLEWLDSLAKPQIPSWQTEQEERQRKQQEKTASRHALHRKQYHTNISKMRAGSYQDILIPAQAYLKLCNDVGQKVPPHKRIAEWLGDELSDAAFEGFEAYLTKKPLFPTSHEIVKIRQESKRYNAEYIIIVGVTERVRKGVGLNELPDDVILAVLFSLRFHSQLEQHAGFSELRVTHIVEQEIEARGLLETSTRDFYEPQLETKKEFVSGLHEFMHDEDKKDVCNTLAYEWLKRFKTLHENTEIQLIKRLVYSYQFDELRSLLREYLDLKNRSHRLIWDVVCFIVDFDNIPETIGNRIDSDFIWLLKDLVQGHYRYGSNLSLSFVQYEWIIQKFRSQWPAVEHPSEETNGSYNAWDASKFIDSFIDQIGSSTDTEAIKTLQRLRCAPEDSYTSRIKMVAAEQHRLVVEASYTPLQLAAIKAIICHTPPKSMADLQALIIEELEVVQAKIRSDDVDSRCAFYDDNNVAHKEERCSSTLIGLLRQGVKGIEYTPELHVANDKEVDITCAIGQLRLPIEVKGQWHNDLWHAADTQLDRLYTQDWRAENRGIYLVLWFGQSQPEHKRLQTPGRGITKPKTAEELQEMLKVNSQATMQGRVEIFVLDLE